MQHQSISPHDAPPSFVTYHQSHQHEQHQTQQHHAAAAAAAAAVTPAQNNYNVAQTVAYPMASFAPFSAPSTEMPFGFDGGMAGSFTPAAAAARATPMPGSLERPEPTHPHDVTAYRQQQQQSSSFGYYPVKEEPMDQRMLLRDQRMQRNMSQQGYMPMMRGPGDDQQHTSPTHHQQQQQQHQQSEWA